MPRPRLGWIFAVLMLAIFPASLDQKMTVTGTGG
jgi:hypothetical protein